MLTVKHCANGRETIVLVDHVTFDARERLLIGFGANQVESGRWNFGHVFVMNDNGKTVGVYNLNK